MYYLYQYGNIFGILMFRIVYVSMIYSVDFNCQHIAMYHISNEM